MSIDWTKLITTEEQENRTREYALNCLTARVRDYLDEGAQTRGYDNILSLCSYVTDSNPKFQQEGQAGVDWRGSVWERYYEILAEVEEGSRPIPSDEELLELLPKLVWPESE